MALYCRSNRIYVDVEPSSLTELSPWENLLPWRNLLQYRRFGVRKQRPRRSNERAFENRGTGPPDDSST